LHHGTGLAFWATMGIGGGPLLFYRGLKAMHTRQLIADTPTARIRSMAMGLVEVNGAVELRSWVNAPFSGKTCAYWEVDISTPGKGWNVVHRNQSGSPFFLRDEDAVALVYPHGATCTIPFGMEEICAGPNLPPPYDEYMRAHPSAVGRLSRLGRLRFRERTIDVGRRVFVLGTAMPRAQERVIEEGDLIQATGTDDAGVTRLRTLDHEVTGVIRRGENEPTFIISEESERSLMTELGAQLTLQLVGGPLITLLGLGYWLAVWHFRRLL
jgi:hypothetical protein